MTQDNTSLLPATLLTGFLGSGKTTLINYLLENNHNEKIMIIENEFGPVNLDSNLLTPNHEFVGHLLHKHLKSFGIPLAF